MAAGLHRMVAHGAREQEAVDYVNDLTPPGDTHVLSRSSLRRMFVTLPPSLLHPDTSSEGQLLEHVQTHQSAQRQQKSAGLSLLTAVEEALLVDWVVRQYNMNAPASPEEVKDRARSLVQERTGEQYESSLRRWYDAFHRRQSGLSLRQPENMPRSWLNAEAKHANIAHFFSLLRAYRTLKPAQIYAADETGLTEDGSRTGQRYQHSTASGAYNSPTASGRRRCVSTVQGVLAA